eukprot:CAMPEP_0197630806 /NCGR_PEP_ID=MMETSP1338-20131121/8170_1 /TAXON_ID=43686 ORGANISM="Pelagodinium beii, Strain RCC1491" /NCGR_SAMPLE_ID=MMETSP1338 /ASSEMBLY_ACC=CAM_ASM_000754 /LENGTH=314 /DNA_ID=CAMNT_0043202109 /DNA_START=113 /DNA_END=1060 /DNA_ORIENTATION=-
MCCEAIAGSSSVKSLEATINNTFKKWDRDGNGTLDADELAEVLRTIGMKMSESSVQKLFREIDVNNDGTIQFEELSSFLCSAPNIPKYFQVLDEIRAEHDKRIAEVIGSYQGGKGQTTQDDEKWHRKQYDARLVPVIKKIFEHHDKKRNGVLEKEESLLFFSNYCEHLLRYYSDLNDRRLLFWLQSGAFHGLNEDMIAAATESMTDLKARQTRSYNEDFVINHRSAFAVIDSMQTGCLELEEVIDALTPGRARYREFHKALNCNTPEAVDLKFIQSARASCHQSMRDDHNSSFTHSKGALDFVGALLIQAYLFD